MAQLPLTPAERAILGFISRYLEKNGYAPTYRLIQEHFEYKSVNAVQKFVQQLVKKNFIALDSGQRRGISLIEATAADAQRIPLAGTVAAGLPIEAVESTDTIEVASSMLKAGSSFFALKVRGDSMKDDAILDGDFVVIRKQRDASNGEIVVALIDNEATIKRFYKKKDIFELHPANANYNIIKVKNDSDFTILGVLTGVIRKY